MKSENSVQIDLKSGRPQLPEKPGVYMFKDESGNLLYVGKAKNLRKRVSSYFSRSPLSSKISNMLSKARFLEFIITSNEKEALLLESNLIKTHSPRYNVVLRDDKRYPVLRLDLREEYPRLSIGRKIQKDGALYFGPFHSASSLRSTLRLINKLFKLRTCKNLPKDGRPCLNYQIGRCLAPCKGDVSREEYMDSVQNAILFLEGKGKELVEKLTEEMFSAADKLEFEKAARIRDQINAIKKVLEKQQMVSPVPENMDVIGIYNKDDLFQVVLLMIRDGFLIGSKNFLFKEKEETPAQVLDAFIKQYYLDCGDVPDSIVIPFDLEERDLVSSFISDKHGKEVKIELACEPRKEELVNMAYKNAQELLRDAELRSDILSEMKTLLGLKKVPVRIEAVDISQLKGAQKVGSIVAFKDGKPDKARYRNFKIKGDYHDDYSMIREVIERRIKKGDLPDMFLIDGGKAHLSSAVQVIKEAGVDDPPDVIAIAKAKDTQHPDKIYLETKSEPLQLPSGHPVLLFLMRIRDEVHRRAISYHRKLRGKEQLDSTLLQIPGLGRKRVEALLTHFKDVKEIAEADEQDIAKIGGIGLKLAKTIKRFLKDE